MIVLSHYIERMNAAFSMQDTSAPWKLTQDVEKILKEKITSLGPDFTVLNNVAIHKSALVDSKAIVQGPAILSANCFVGPHAYLRGGVFLDENTLVGPGCEVKTSFIFAGTALAHFNFVGDSILGSNVNLEAGSIIANHYNERADKRIFVQINGRPFSTNVLKFGALVGDRTKIGANAVLSPGTILMPDSIVKRLELIDQSVNM